MTTLSTTEINAIAAEAAGVEPTRSANKERAIAKLTSAMEAIVGKDNAAKAAQPGKRAAILEAAQRGDLPAAPDFSAETHKRFRAKLAEIVAAAEAGDIAKLKAFTINPVSSSPKAMAKYRDLAVIALEARAAKAA